MTLAARTLEADRDPVLAAMAGAPTVPMTNEERALVAEFERTHTHWIADAEFGKTVDTLRDDR